MIKTILNLPLSFAQSMVSKFSLLSGKIREKLNEPIQSNFLSLNGVIQSISAAVIVFAVAFIAQPYGISQFSSPNKTFFIGALALSAFVGLGISLFALPSIFSSFYNKNKWTVSKAILGNVITAFFCGLSVMVFGNQIGLTQFDLPMELLKFTAIFAAVSLIYNFILQSILNKRFDQKSEVLTSKIIGMELIENKSKVFPIAKFVGANDVISLVPNQLIKVEMSKYSSEFVFQNLFGTAVKTLDISENEVRKEISNYEQFIQLDKNVFINKNAISQATGDAAGIKVAVHKVNDSIRVSKKYLKNL
ncbi:hypothetical protein SAMN06298216_0856 [Spirosomataceae bacterium TFI 002]|nr:hypothetical protein SAMN06298216_0856 [Spirosomataceae bacterium TFI 002]